MTGARDVAPRRDVKVIVAGPQVWDAALSCQAGPTLEH